MSFLSKIGKLVAPSAATATSAAAPKTPSSAIAAKERLSVILASQRGSELLQNINMDLLQKDVLDVVKRHIDGVASNSPVNCQVKNEGEVNLFEMSVEIDSAVSRNVGGVGAGAGGQQQRPMRPATVTLQASP